MGIGRMYPLPVLPSSGQPPQSRVYRSYGALSVSPLHSIHLALSVVSGWRKSYPLQEEAAVLASLVKATIIHEKLDTGVVFLALLAWPKGTFP
jgi:hypothetical protein